MKRALSLALSSVMLLGMMVVGTGAKGYDDVTAEHNVEAIEVLEAMGVMEGTGNGFNPDAKVTRQEMAVIMCNVLDLTVSSYKGTTSFTDVDTWALPYVEACYTNGIITGYSATEFGAKDSLTTGQAALMLMKALGYFQEQGDFGIDWLVATTKQGALIDLFNGVDNGAKEALTRNDVAQLVLNALKADMVYIYQYDVVSDGKGGFTTKANYDSRANKVGVDYTVDTTTDSNNNPIGNEVTLQLIEELYGNTFKLNADEKDDFGRPAAVWTEKLETIGVYTSAATATYTKGVSKADMYTLLGATVYNGLLATTPNTLEYYVDGKPVDLDADVNVGDNDTKLDAAELNILAKKNDVATAGATGNGALTEVFIKNNGNVVITVTNTYLVEAAGDYNTVKGEARFTRYEDVDQVTLSSYVLSSDDWDGLEKIEDGDFLLITAAWNGTNYDVMSVAFAQTVEGVVDTYTQNIDVNNQANTSTDGKDITLAGTKYSYAVTAGGQDDLDFSVGQEAALVLDQYGYVIGIAETMLNANFVYVLGAAPSTTLIGSEVKAIVAYMDGTVETVTLNKVTSGSTTVKATGSEAGWYTYAKTTSGAMNLMDVPAAYTVDGITEAARTVTNNAVLFDGTKATSYTGKTWLNNNKTALVIVDPNVEGSVFVGAKAMPQVLGTSFAEGDETYTISVLLKNGYVAYAVMDLIDTTMVDLDSDGNDDEYRNQANEFSVIDVNADPEYLFLLDAVSEHHIANGVKYYTYETLKADGTVENITYEAAAISSQYSLIKKAHYNKDGYVVNSTPVVTAGSEFNFWASSNVIGTKYSNGVLSFYETSNDVNFVDQDFIVTDDTQIFMILDGDTGLTKLANTKYEVNDVKAATVGNVLNGYAFKGRIAGKVVEANTNVLETLYIYVDSKA